MFGFLTAIPQLLSGLFGTVNGITQALSNEKIALINATTDREKIEIQERINALQATASALAAESARSSIPMLVQLLLVLPIGFVMAKIYVWDRALGWGSTPNLSAQEWYLVYVVYGFYFVHSTVGMFK